MKENNFHSQSLIRASEFYFIILFIFVFSCVFYIGQTHCKGSKDKGGRRTSTDNHEENVENDESIGNMQKLQPQQPQQKLEGKVAKMIEKAEQRRMKRISRQKEVFFFIYLFIYLFFVSRKHLLIIRLCIVYGRIAQPVDCTPCNRKVTDSIPDHRQLSLRVAYIG